MKLLRFRSLLGTSVAVCLLGSAFAGFTHCANLNPLTADACGNAVVDPGEECDTYPSPGCGKPGTPFACKFECADTSNCPTGYSCGLDSICRAPSGAFLPLGSPTEQGGTELALADFNGDGLADAFLRSALDEFGGGGMTIAYLGGNGTVQGTYGVADKLRGPFIADINGDGLADVVGGLAINGLQGLGVFFGQATPNLLPAPLPTLALPSSLATARAIPIDGFGPSYALGYFVGSDTNADGIGPGLYFPGVSDAGTSFAALTKVPMPVGPSEVAGHIVVTRLRPSDPCPDIVFVDQASTVYMVQPCVSTAGVITLDTKAQATTLKLPGGSKGCLSTAAGAVDCGPGVFVGNVDGVNGLDIVISATRTATGYGTFVALADAQGEFGQPQLVAPVTILGMTTAVGEPEVVTLGRTLAVGDVNGDGYADFFAEALPMTDPAATTGTDGPTTQVGLLVSQLSSDFDGGPADFLAGYQEPIHSGAWSNATIANINGEGAPELVAATPNDADFDVFLFSTLADGFTHVEHTTVATLGSIGQLVVSDFDGDSIDDLAFDQVDPARDGSHDVAILYGVAAGFPGAPVVAGRYPPNTSSPANPIVDLGALAPYSAFDVVTRSAAGLSMSIYDTGAGGRPPLASAPLQPAGTFGGTSSSVLVVAAGSFVGTGGGDAGSASPLGLVAVGEPAATTTPDAVWYFANSGASVGLALGGPNASSGASNFNASPEQSILTPTGPDPAALMTAGFLQAKGPASVVAVATATGGSALFVGATTANGSTTVISPSNASGGVLPVLANVSVAPDGQLALLDIDGDGQNDLVLLTGTAPTTGFCTHFAQMTRSLLVFWNNNGTFDVNHPSTVATCNVDCANAAVGTFTGQTCPGPFATLHTGTGAAPTLAYVAATEPASSEVTTVAFVHTGGPGNHVFSPPTTPSLMRVGADGGVVGDGGALLPSTVKIDAIASGDINGDGVDDLAILAKGILYLFQGVPVQP